MTTRPTLAVLATLACASGALGQTMQFSLSASQTEVSADNPSITIEVHASWDGDPVGFAAAAFDLLGISNWETGEVSSIVGNPALYDAWSEDEGLLQPNNDIFDSTPQQLPPFFNPDFDASNPISLLTIEWETDDFTPRQVCLQVLPLVGDVYLDDFGTTMSLNLAGETLCFEVISGSCPGDFNNDGSVDTRDVLDFLNAWTAGDRRADWNQDGSIDTRDVLHFLNDWLTLC